jgi:hypothetical protein
VEVDIGLQCGSGIADRRHLQAAAATLHQEALGAQLPECGHYRLARSDGARLRAARRAGRARRQSRRSDAERCATLAPTIDSLAGVTYCWVTAPTDPRAD